MINQHNHVQASHLLLGLAVVIATCAAGQRGLPTQEGIANFGKVTERLYRGAQPDEAGIKNLKRLGIKTILNLRMTNEVMKVEEAEARANGMVYTNVPMSGVGRPTDAQVSKALSLLETLPSPVFVHCEHGCDRTGTIIACYRIRHEKWSSQSAMREADQFGMSRLERGMRSYVEDFGKARK